jgi:hypothetical protein
VEGIGAIVSILTLIIGIVLIVAQLRLFSIDGTLKAILAEMQRQNSSLPAPAASPEDQSKEELRAKIADVQKNWPGYK